MLDEIVIRISRKVLDIADIPGDQVVHADYLIALGKQAVSEM